VPWNELYIFCQAQIHRDTPQEIQPPTLLTGLANRCRNAAQMPSTNAALPVTSFLSPSFCASKKTSSGRASIYTLGPVLEGIVTKQKATY